MSAFSKITMSQRLQSLQRLLALSDLSQGKYAYQAMASSQIDYVNLAVCKTIAVPGEDGHSGYKSLQKQDLNVVEVSGSRLEIWMRLKLNSITCHLQDLQDKSVLRQMERRASALESGHPKKSRYNYHFTSSHLLLLLHCLLLSSLLVFFSLD